MPENVNKEKTKAETYLIYFGMFITFMSTLVYPTLDQYFPELTENARQKELIHDEAMQVALEFPTKINERYKEDSIQFEQKLNAIRTHNRRLRAEMLTLKDETISLRKQIEFNTFNVSAASECIYYCMELSEQECSFDYRHGIDKSDRFVLFNDWYKSQSIQRIQIGGGCSAFIYPFERSRIKIN